MSHKTFKTLSVLGVATVATGVATSVHAEETQAPTATTSQTTQTETTDPQKAFDQASKDYDTAKANEASAKNTLDTAKETEVKAQTEVTLATKATQEAKQVVTDTQSAQETAQKDLDTANQSLANAQANLDKEADANPNADRDLTQAENAVTKAQEQDKLAQDHLTQAEQDVTNNEKASAQIKAAVDTAQADHDKAQETLAQTRAQVADAKADQADAQAALTDTQNKVDQSLAKLQKAVDEASATISHTEKRVLTNVEALNYMRNYEKPGYDGKDGTGSHEIVVNEGKETVDITLTPEQEAEFRQTGIITYTPNAKKITEYMVDYINRLRDLNGIQGHLTAGDAYLLETAYLRAKENDDRDLITHVSKIKRPHYNEVAKGTIYRFRSDFDFQDHIVLSDQQMAYMELSQWFSDYANLAEDTPGHFVPGYIAFGHRNALLFTKKDFAYGYAQKDKPKKDYETDNGQAVGISSSGAVNREELDKVTYERGADSRLYQYFNGKRINFLPDITFNYVLNEVITEPSSEKANAQKHLDDYKAIAEKDLANAKETLNKATVHLNAVQADAQKAQNAYTSAKETLEARQKDLTTSQKALLDARTRLVDAKADATVATQNLKKAETQLAQIKAKHGALTQAKTTFDKASQAIKEAKETLANRTKALEKAKQALTDAQTRLTKAKEANQKAITARETAEKIYQEAQAKTKETAKAYGQAQAQLALKPNKPADKPSDKPADKPSDKPADKSDKPSDKSDKSDKPADKPDKSNSVSIDKPNWMKPEKLAQPGKSNGTSIDKPNWMKPEKLAQQGPINKPSPALPYVPKHDRKTLPQTGDHANLLALFGTLLLSASLLIFKKNKNNA